MHTTLVSATELRSILDSRDAIVLLDARTDRGAYDAGHLPGAQFADSGAHLSSVSPSTDAAKGGRHPLPAIDVWCRTVGEWGITPSTQVVVYDDQSGANAAARAWWMLRSIGHEQVAVLDGGLAAAVAAGLPTTTELPVVTTAAPYPGRSWTRPVADMKRVDALRQSREWKVLDVRSAPRFEGLEEPIDPIAGHIPGAVNLYFARNLRDGVYKEAGELRELYEELLQGTAPDHLVVHCGSGVTACHTLLALERAGLSGAALYVGSWSEWCRRAGTVVIA
jgi:thiosulfate/3-mercaptopyruvate sulfurtransferase